MAVFGILPRGQAAPLTVTASGPTTPINGALALKITLSNARGSRNNKLDAIDIVSAGLVPATLQRLLGPRSFRARR